MNSPKIAFLACIVAIAAACTEGRTPEPDKQVRKSKLDDRILAERRMVASQRLVRPSSSFSLTSATDMATALDIPAEMMVVDGAELTSPDPEAALVLPGFGSAINPRRGNSLVVMSTGRINNANFLPEPGSDFAPGGTDGDATTLTIKVNVPAGANRLSFDFNFLSAESPDFIGSQFNDMFTARVTDAVSTRVIAEASVNSSFFFDVSATRAAGTFFDVLMADDPAGVESFPVDYPGDILLFPDAGITDFQTVNVPVAGGGLVTLEFDIRDLGDGIMDSTVVIDNITFSGIEVVDPNPDLINQFLGTIETAPLKLVSKGRDVDGVAADGVTQLLLRVKVPGPGTMEFSLDGATSPQDGGLGAVGSADRSGSVTVEVQEVTPGQYYAFALYTSPEDFNTGAYAEATTRAVRVAVQYTPKSGMGFQGRREITIHRPPVVAVHDIWDSCQYWSDIASILKNSLLATTCADYSATNSESINSSKNRTVVPDFVNQALVKMRDRNIAVTQVDVVAHGMGGILSRKFVDTPGYLGARNFNLGDFNRLITLNTPHVGTRLADEIVVMRNHILNGAKPQNWADVQKALTFGTSKISIDQGTAIDDLMTTSPAIQSIKQTVVPSHALVSRGGLALPRGSVSPPIPGSFNILQDRLQRLYNQIELRHPLNSSVPFPDRAKLILGPESKLFCSDDHDLFIAEADQKGGIADNAITYFNVELAARTSEHSQTLGNAAHNDRIIELLNSPVGGGLFAPSIPSPSVVAPVNSCKGGGIAPQLAGDGSLAVKDATREASAQPLSGGSLQIVSPGAGTPVSPGGRVTVVVEASGGFQPEAVVILGAASSVFLETPPFVAEVSIPAQAIGTTEFVAYGIDAQGEILLSEPVVLPVSSSAKLTSLEIINGDAILTGPGVTRRLLVLGHYNDGVSRDLSLPGRGTLYSSSNLNVATVSQDGTITSTGPGIATIVVRNGAIFTSITVKVGNNSFGQCIEVRLGDYNLFVLEDYSQGHSVDGRVAAGGNIALEDFSVGRGLPDTDTVNALVAGGNITLARGGVGGDVRYGGQLVSDDSVSITRGTAAHGTSIDFNASGNSMRGLSARLAALPANGTTTLEPWGGIMLGGTSNKVNVFELDASAFNGATLLSIDAPANSLAVINVRGTSATLSSFGQVLNGGIDKQGILFNFPDATSLGASGLGLQGTMLAPKAHIVFTNGTWEGGIYARSLTGNASGQINRLRDTDICL